MIYWNDATGSDFVINKNVHQLISYLNEIGGYTKKQWNKSVRSATLLL